jgi:hypothetical protein
VTVGAQPVAPTPPALTDSDDDVVTDPDAPIDTMDDDGLDDTYVAPITAPVYVTPAAPPPDPTEPPQQSASPTFTSAAAYDLWLQQTGLAQEENSENTICDFGTDSNGFCLPDPDGGGW